MNKDPENSDSKHNSQASKNSSTEDTEYANKENSLHESKLSEAFDNEKLVDEDPVTEKQSATGKWRLFLLLIIITLTTGGYFYAQKKGINLAFLPLDLNKSFPETTFPNPLIVQPKTLPIQSGSKINEQIVELRTLENPTSENKTTVNLLRNEIQFLKEELAKKNKLPKLQNFRNGIPRISGAFVGKVSNESIAEETGLELEVQTSSVAAPPVEEKNTEPIFEAQTSSMVVQAAESKLLPKQSQRKKIAPERSKEVQAYLDFIENTGEKIIYLIKEWSNQLINLVL